MGAFELANTDKKSANEEIAGVSAARPLNPRRLREECIIALKVYDSCRQQDCLTPDILGPARAAECVTIGDETTREGDIIDPPSDDGI